SGIAFHPCDKYPVAFSMHGADLVSIAASAGMYWHVELVGAVDEVNGCDTAGTAFVLIKWVQVCGGDPGVAVAAFAVANLSPATIGFDHVDPVSGRMQRIYLAFVCTTVGIHWRVFAVGAFDSVRRRLWLGRFRCLRFGRAAT